LGGADEQRRQVVRWRNRLVGVKRIDVLTAAPRYSDHDWFTEGFDTLDLKGAKALLEQLG
jgi:hypothetical protein